MTSSVRPTTATTTTPSEPHSISSSSNTTSLAFLVAASAVLVVSSVARIYYYKKRCHHPSSNTDDASSSWSSLQEERYRIVLETIQQRRSIYPKQYYNSNNNNDTTTPSNTRHNNSDNNHNVGVPREILNDMLEAARWAPTHHLTQPWYFMVFDTLESRQRLGTFMAQQYQRQCQQKNNKPFSQAKYDKKIRSCTQASYVIAVCLKRSSTNHNKNPAVEDVCSVAMAVQNMHLVASTAQYQYHSYYSSNDNDSNNSNKDNIDKKPPAMIRRMGVGAYWSTSGIYHHPNDDNTATTNPSHPSSSVAATVVTNPPALVEFLQLDPTTTTCLGWFLVGPYDNGWTTGTKNKSPPRGRRDPMNQDKVQWM